MNGDILPRRGSGQSALVPLIRGYLEYHGRMDQEYHRPFVIWEADRIAATIRDRFGRFDESDWDSCARFIRFHIEGRMYPD